MAQFTIYWLDGTRDVLEGYDAADALNQAGYGSGATKAIDFWVGGDDHNYTWDASAKNWVQTKSALKKVEPGQVYRNKKTKVIYYVKFLAKHSETEEPLVVYYSNDSEDIGRMVWVRPLELFKEKFEQV